MGNNTACCSRQPGLQKSDLKNMEQRKGPPQITGKMNLERKNDKDQQKQIQKVVECTNPNNHHFKNKTFEC